MSGYLQRLLDRAPPSAAPAATGLISTPASVLPAGPSLSPVALADQRLNDPSLLDQLGLPPVAETGFGESTEQAANAPTAISAPTRTHTHPPAPHTPEPALQVTPEPAAPQPAEPPRSTIESEARPAPRRIRQDPSEIDAFDLLPPETKSPPAQAQEVAEPTPVDAVFSPPVSAARTEVPESPADAISRAQPERAEPGPAQHAHAPQIEAEPPRPQTMPAADTKAQAPTATQPADAQIIEIEPPPQRQPAPLPPALETHAPAPEHAKETKPEKAPKREPEPSPREPEKSASPRSAPRTAAAASIIGPLSQRPRALTLFGLRRR